MKPNHAFGIGAAATAFLFAAFASAETKVVLNAKQLGIDSVEVDFDEAPAEPSVGEADLAGIDLSDLDIGGDAADGVDAAADAAEQADESLDAIVPTVDESTAEAASLLEDDPVEILPTIEEEAVSPVDELVPVVEDAVVTDLDPVDVAALAEAEAPAPVVEEEPGPEPAPVEEVAVAEVAPAEEEPAPEEVAEAAQPSEVDVEISELASLEESRRTLFIQHASENFEEGKANLAAGNWVRAADNFKEAIRFYERVDTTATHHLLADARAQLAEAYYRIAEKRLSDIESRREQATPELFNEAETAAGLAIKLGHPKAQAMLDRIKNLQANPPKPVQQPRKPRYAQDDFKSQRKDIRDRMRVAREYYSTGEYTDCRREVELILRDYPWCRPALDLLHKLAVREHQWKEFESRTTREDMLRDVTAAKNARMYAVDYVAGDTSVSAGAGEGESASASQALGPEMRIREKMNRIIIPEIEFRQANVADVIAFLSEASREFDDPNTPDQERGVNFVLDLGDAGAAETSAVADDDPWGAPAAAAPAASSGGVAPLTIRTRYSSLLSTLDMIMEMAKLKYRIQGNVVMIMPANKADGALIHRMYNVLPTIVERTVSLGGGDSSGSGSVGDPFALNPGEVKTTTDWKAFFSKLGVAWPDGSTVEYMQSMGKLVVKNTASNLATLEQVLGAINVTPFQVEIEVRFVEVGQTDLNSLGLEWILNDDWEIAEKKKDANLPLASRQRITMSAQNVTGGFNFLTDNSKTDLNNGNPIIDSIAKVNSVLTNPELSLVLHALANKSSADLLSAPKVVAQNGTQATIKSVVEYIYPTNFEVEYPEDNGDSTAVIGVAQIVSTFPAVEPQDFQTREVGVILQVTPRVSADGTRITLDLTPSVVSEPTWKDYGYTYPTSDGSGFHLTMEQPFFPVRSLATSVDIYNGCTVVMGGMITEERYAEEDKIPILGDIPLLGRLFRYKYEQSEKRNLLIFVSARLVDPAGREVKGTDSSLGVLDQTAQNSAD
ncbi:MAG: hypothetical protein IJ678_01690 [Kiritimatiellae bacterium]|nr:hypothetical protein [Kiritimatiellia bacterium]